LQVFVMLGAALPLAYAQSPSTIMLTASSTNPPENTPVVLTATIPGATSGFVSFYNGSMLLGRSPIVSGVATLKHAFAGGWSSVVNAQYSGNATLASSVTAIPLSISTIGSTTHLLSVAGGPGAYQLTDTVTADGLINPTGIVTFMDQSNGAVVGTQPLSPGNIVSSTTMNSGGGLGWWVGPTPPAMAVADFNGDGLPDAVVSYGTLTTVAAGACPNPGGGFTVLIGNGPASTSNNGNFHAGQSVCQAGIVNIVAADFDNDGVIDLLVATATGVTLYHGNGDGTFGDGTINATGTTTAIPCGTALVAGNITNNTDSNLGFVCADNSTGDVTAFTNDGAGNFTQSWQITVAGAAGMDIGTYTSTAVSPLGGALNLALSTSNGAGSGVYAGNGDGTFTRDANFAGGDWAGALVWVDIDGDGNTDILAVYGTGGTHPFSPYRGNGQGGFSASGQTAWTGNFSHIAVGDFTGTGVPGWSALTGNQVFLWQNKSTPGVDPFLWPQITIAGSNSFSIDTNAPLIFADVNVNGLDELYSPAAQLLNRFVPVNRSVSTAAFQTPGPAGPGTVTPVVATYPGNIFYMAATPAPSNAVYLVTRPLTPAVTVTPNFSTVQLGEMITFTAQVAGQAGLTPTGAVTFTDTTTGEVLGGPIMLDTSGMASFTAIDTPAGNHIITATYDPETDPNYLTAIGSTSITIQRVLPTILLTTSQASVSENTSVTFTATIAPQAGTYPITGGIVTFYSNGEPIGTGMLNATGVATFTPSPVLAVGQYAISASYLGDNNFTSGSSNTVIQTVLSSAPSVRTPTTTTVNTTATVTSAGVFLTAAVTSAVDAPNLTGTVDFFYQGSLIGAGILGPVTTNMDGSLTATAISSAISTSELVPENTYTISANYLGDVSNLPSNSAATSVAIPAAPPPTETRTPTTTDVSTTATITSAGVLLSAVVTSSPGAPNLTGTVNFIYNGDVIGAGILGPVIAGAGGVLTATAISSAVSTSVLAPGNTYSIAANYLGDISNLPSSGTAVSVAIPSTPPPPPPGGGDFSVNITNNTTQTIHPGDSASFTVSVGFVTSSFNDPVILTITAAPGQTGLPPGAVAVFSPPSVTPGGGTALSTLTIQTSLTNAGNKTVKPFSATNVALALLLFPFIWVCRLRRTMSALPRVTLLVVWTLVYLGALTGVSGCGSGEGYFGIRPQTFTFTVTGTSGALTHTALQTVTLNLR